MARYRLMEMNTGPLKPRVSAQAFKRRKDAETAAREYPKGNVAVIHATK